MLLLAAITSSFAGGDYGGGPKIIELMKQDTHVNVKDIKLTKDKLLVELTIAYRMVRTGTNPLLTEEEEKKLRLGKYSAIKFKYDKELFHQDTIDKLNKRKKFFYSKKKYKKLARKYFEIEEVKNTNKRVLKRKYYELRLK
jgi:hypothetical protein